MWCDANEWRAFNGISFAIFYFSEIDIVCFGRNKVDFVSLGFVISMDDFVPVFDEIFGGSVFGALPVL